MAGNLCEHRLQPKRTSSQVYRMTCLPTTDLGTSCNSHVVLLLPVTLLLIDEVRILLRAAAAVAIALLAAAAARVSAKEALRRAIEASRLE